MIHTRMMVENSIMEQMASEIYYIGWQVIDGNWYYFNSKSEAVDGWKIINGVKYYFGKTNHFMYTGYKVISGELYYFEWKWRQPWY